MLLKFCRTVISLIFHDYPTTEKVQLSSKFEIFLCRSSDRLFHCMKNSKFHKQWKCLCCTTDPKSSHNYQEVLTTKFTDKRFKLKIWTMKFSLKFFKKEEPTNLIYQDLLEKQNDFLITLMH